ACSGPDTRSSTAGFGGRRIGRLDRCRRTPRLFKYKCIKAQGVAMGKKAPGLAAVAAFLLTLAACGGNTGTTTQTDVGVTNNSILLGTTIALSGAAAAYGTIANAE